MGQLLTACRGFGEVQGTQSPDAVRIQQARLAAPGAAIEREYSPSLARGGYDLLDVLDHLGQPAAREVSGDLDRTCAALRGPVAGKKDRNLRRAHTGSLARRLKRLTYFACLALHYL